MRLIGPVLVALIMEFSLIAFEAYAQHRPVNVSASFALGNAEAANPAVKKDEAIGRDPKGGYLGIKLNETTVNYVFPNSPAEAAGLMVGDKILDVNDQTTFGLTGAGLAEKIVGRAGSEVDLVVERKDTRKRFCLLRAEPGVSEQDALLAEKENFRKCAQSLN
jgi:predicted metalloprotease with PDZ domain